jgi:hypothetical protein
MSRRISTRPWTTLSPGRSRCAGRQVAIAHLDRLRLPNVQRFARLDAMLDATVRLVQELSAAQ